MIGIESVKTMSMENVGTWVLDKNKEHYLRCKVKAKNHLRCKVKAQNHMMY